MAGHHFISYSRILEAEEFAFRLYDALQAGPPSYAVWLDQRDLSPATDWDEQIVEALRTCDSLLFVMTRDSVEPQSGCKLEWTRALKYKKPVVPLLLHRDAEQPFRLGNRQHIDCSGAFPAAVARLRTYLHELTSPEGILHGMTDRLADAERDLRRVTNLEQRRRIEDDITLLKKQIADQQRLVDDPQSVSIRVDENITRALERECQPETPAINQPAQPASSSSISRAKFINLPPSLAPSYFQNRYIETKLVGDFLKDESRRLLTVVGRGGIGKTAMVCRLLKALENNQLPDEGGPWSVDGIVYLSAIGSHRVSFPNLYADLSRLLTEDVSRRLAVLYRNPQSSTALKMHALLDAFPQGRIVLLLDNFEDVVDPDTVTISNSELSEALRALLNLPQHAIKVIVTTRVAPRDLLLIQPGRQSRLDLDEGLESPYAENILREMDTDGKVGLRTAPDDLLNKAREHTRGYPRALEALFAILSADRDTSLGDILADAARRLPENVVRDLVGEAFSRLDSAAQMVMQGLAIYSRPVPPAAVDYLLKPYLPGVDSAPVLNRLVNMHFTRKEAGRYYLHPVDRAYALSRVPKGDKADRYDNRTSLFRDLRIQNEVAADDLTRGDINSPLFTQYALWDRAGDYFEEVRKPRGTWQTIEDLAPQLAEFELRYEGQDYDPAASVLHEISFRHLLRWGHYPLVVEMLERLHDKLNDPELRIQNLNHLGATYQRMGQFQKAMPYYQQAIECARETRKRGLEYAVMANLANCYGSVGRHADALDLHEQVLVVVREYRDRKTEGSVLGLLGIDYESVGKLAQAIDHHEQALAIAHKEGDRHLEEGELHNVASCYGALGQIARAMELYEQALAISPETGDRDWQANHISSLAECHQRLGGTARAMELYEQALAIRRETGNRSGEASELRGLGSCYATLGQTTQAIEFYEQALAIRRETGHRDGEGGILDELAEVSSDMGNYGEGALRAAEAVKLGQETGIPLSYRYSTLALTYLCDGNLPAARTAAESACRYDQPLNNHYAQVLLGTMALKQVDYPAAQEAFAAAADHANALLSHSTQIFKALDTRGLALCGLTLCGKGDHITGAVEAFRAARRRNKHAGSVGRVLRLLDALVPVDSVGVVAQVRAAAAGE